MNEQIYNCLLCNRAFNSSQALRAHLKVHKEDLCDFNVRVPKYLREEFKRACHNHGTTTCHLIVAFMKAVVEQEKRGIFPFPLTTNPIVVNFTYHDHHYGRPRSPYRYTRPADLTKPYLDYYACERCEISFEPSVIEHHPSMWRNKCPYCGLELRLVYKKGRS